MKYHYYLVCVDGVGRNHGKWSVNLKFESMRVNKQAMRECIDAVSKQRSIDKSDLVVTAVSYLGFMTEEEFNT